MSLDFGREVCGRLDLAESREWLCANGIGGFASGTVAGSLTRRYHGLLVAALNPPLGRTLLVARLDETLLYGDARVPLYTNRWAGGVVDPHGYQEIERFRLEGTTPVWTYAFADARLEKRIWMEPGANTTCVQYRLIEAGAPATLEVKALVDYRDYHATTRGGGWRMRVETRPGGLVVTPFDGARPVSLLAAGARAEAAHVWHHGFDLPAERERGLEAEEDHLHAGTFHATLAPGEAVTLVLSAEAAPSLDGEAAWRRRQRHEADLLARFHAAHRATRGTATRGTPAWVDRLALAADQFVVKRALPDDPQALSVIAGYHWFGDWGRDTMIALPGLALATGRPEVARKVLTTFGRFVDRGMLPNRFPDGGEAPEYNTADATLWYVEAIRAYHAATGDDTLLADLFPVLEDVFRWHRQGTRYGIGVDPADGLLRSGEAGVQLTWMDAKVGDRVVTPRTGKAVEINALWHNALAATAAFARRLGRPAEAWEADAARVAASFGRFWNEAAGCCYDVVDGPGGDDPTLRPNQIFAVSLEASPLSPARQRGVVDACARHLLTSFGLRSLDPRHPSYVARYGGGPRERDGGYHQGTVWGWLLGPFALAHLKVHGDPAAAEAFLTPMAHQLADYGLGSLGEIFDAEPPFTPRGCIAQAWSVSETLRAWLAVAEAGEAAALPPRSAVEGIAPRVSAATNRREGAAHPTPAGRHAPGGKPPAPPRT